VDFRHLALSSKSIVADILTVEAIIIRMSQSDLEVAPLRNLVIFGDTRFEMPDTKDPGRWTNRVVNNLLYYQTNYFLSALVIFFLISSINPGKMLMGMITIGIVCGALYFFAQSQGSERAEYKGLVLVATICLVLFQFTCILFFLSSVVFPLKLILLHASLRCRNTKSKVSNVAETFGLKKRTPMGFLLNELGIEPDMYMNKKKTM